MKYKTQNKSKKPGRRTILKQTYSSEEKKRKKLKSKLP